HRLTSVAKSLEYRGQQQSIAQKVGGDGADYHTKGKHRGGAAAEQDEEAGGNPRGGPEHGNVGGLSAEGKPELGGQKIGNREGGDLTENADHPCGQIPQVW